MAITVVPVKLPAAGRYFALLGANASIQYNPDNLGLVYNDPTATPAAGTWRQLAAVSTAAFFETDGYGVRVLCGGGAGTSKYSRMKLAAAGIGTPGNSFGTEVSNAQIPITASGAAPVGGITTITATAHGEAVGDIVTFAGAATAGYNDTNFQVLSVPTANTFTIATGTLGTLA